MRLSDLCPEYPTQAHTRLHCAPWVLNWCLWTGRGGKCSEWAGHRLSLVLNQWHPLLLEMSPWPGGMWALSNVEMLSPFAAAALRAFPVRRRLKVFMFYWQLEIRSSWGCSEGGAGETETGWIAQKCEHPSWGSTVAPWPERIKVWSLRNLMVNYKPTEQSIVWVFILLLW
jgi:hypothetical protein